MDARQGQRRVRWIALMLPGILLCVLIAGALGARTAEATSPHVDLIVLNSDIAPASLRLLTQAIDKAEHDGAQALIIEIDTPGGDIDSMNKMAQAELASRVPLLSYVGPAGAHAASAGAFVALAAQVAAMAPTTRIGASSPVTSTGGDIDQTLKAKIEEDLSRLMSGIQTRYGRNVDEAVRMITDAKSYDDTTAVRDRIVDLSAVDVNDLLAKVDGRVVTLNDGQKMSLQTAGASIEKITPSAADSFYGFLLDPNIVFLLFIVAMIGIYLEIAHPGAILPGVTGAIALLLFLFAAGSLTPNWAGLGLMVLAFVLLLLDLRLPTHGVLTVGALVSLIVGVFIFFNSGNPYGGPQVNPVVVYAVAGFIGLLSLTLISMIVRARRTPVSTGAGVEGMIGARVVALTKLAPEGRVSYGGENWAAGLEGPDEAVEAGTELQITGVTGLRLSVRPLGILLPVEERQLSPRE